MPELDPIVIQLRAEMGRYKAELKAATALSETSFNRIDRDVKRLEQQFAKSSNAIGGSLRGLAGTFAAAFSTQQVVGLIDSYTRLQNSLKVAGLEGENLAGVQQRLLDLSGRYGVNIEELARLFGNSSQAASDLGASQDQLVQLTEATAQSLKITGTSAVQAQGAILGLTQALASGTVRAEEFNQINEGGLRPLLQLAANTEQFGGSVARLRQAVVDGKVSSEQFFQAILNGSAELEGKASKATLTLAGAFESLSSQLTVYVGQAAEANGVTNALATGIQTLANNLNVVIPALAAIGSVLVVGRVAAYTAGLLSAASAAGGLSVAAAGAGRALLAAFGGPVGIAVSALAVGVGYLATRTEEGSVASGVYRKAQDAAAEASQRAGDAADKLATATGRARVEALANAKVLREETKQKLASAQASLILATAEAARAQSLAKRTASNQFVNADLRTGAVAKRATAATASEATANEAAARESVRVLQAALDKVNAAINAAPAVGAVSAGPIEKRGRGGGATASGPSATEITARFNSELIALTQQTLSAQSSLATSANERAELELRAVEFARIAAQNDIDAATEYSAAQKKRLLAQVEELAFYERERIARDEREQLEQEAQDIAEARFRAQEDLLQGQLDLAQSDGERRDLALQLLDLEFQYRDDLLERIKNNKDLSKAVRDQAEIAQGALRAAQPGRVENARRDTESPGERFLREVQRSQQQLTEDFQSVAVDGLQSLNDGLVDAIVNAKSLGQVFSGVAKQIVADLLRIAIQQAVIRPLAESLFGGGGGGGGFGGILSFASLFAARASGGPVSAGRLYRVNEAAGGGSVELFQPAQNGNIVPLGQARAAMNGGGGRQGPIEIKVYADEGRTFVPRVQGISADVAVTVVRVASDDIVKASANEALRQAGRRKL